MKASRSVLTLRNRNGSLIVDFAAGLFVFPIVTLLSINVGLVGLGAWVNDAACKDAARAAGQKSDPTIAKVAAQKVVDGYAANGVLGKIRLDDEGTNFAYVVLRDINGEDGLNRAFVRVTTKVTIRMPAPVIFAENKLSDSITLRQQYTFPVIDPNPSAATTPDPGLTASAATTTAPASTAPDLADSELADPDVAELPENQDDPDAVGTRPTVSEADETGDD
jgi:hypothetical protein